MEMKQFCQSWAELKIWRMELQIGFKACTESISSGSVAEWSKALVLGTSLFGGVGSNPIAAILLHQQMIWKL